MSRAPARSLLALLVLAWPVGALAQQDARPDALTQEQRQAEIRQLGWLSGSQHLDSSKSILALPDGFRLVKNADAKRLDELINAHSASEVEAIVVGDHGLIYFTHTDDGYVTEDDWSSVDVKAMIDQISQGTEAGNAQRQAQGLPPVHVAGWLQEPVFDKDNNMVHWAIQATEDGGDALVNAVTLKLDRYGYERINWATSLAEYTPTGGAADVMLAAQSFEPGARYSDHVSADKVAGYGIGALVATVAGVKLAKVLGFGALILLAKKFLVVIIAGIGAAFAAVKRLFSSRKQS